MHTASQISVCSSAENIYYSYPTVTLTLWKISNGLVDTGYVISNLVTLYDPYYMSMRGT